MTMERLPHDPTPEEIAAACRVIQSRWSEHERRKRSAWAVTAPVEVPSAEVEVDESST